MIMMIIILSKKLVHSQLSLLFAFSRNTQNDIKLPFKRQVVGNMDSIGSENLE